MAEPGELLDEALAREVREETGLAITGPPRLVFWSQYAAGTGPARGTWTAYTFAAAVHRGEPAPADTDGLVTAAR